MSERPVAAVGAVIVEDRHLLVIKRAGQPHAGRWAVPGGRVEPGESLVAALEREVREETGLEIAVGDVAWVGETIGSGDPPAWHYVIVDFWSTRVGGELQAGDDAAAIDWVPIDAASDWPMVDTMRELIDVLKAGG
ncbi:MAG: NUDIX domain-containing protein [Acidimicrobiia bacterium]|nr:NUDIX domain-containing protein [Acidimicrobiia bacterium]